MRHFDEMWEETIYPTICSTYDSIEDLTIKNNLIINQSSNYQKALEKEYDKLRWRFKKEWYNKLCTKSDENLLDFHKIGAVICAALIKCKPFVFDEKLMTRIINSHSGSVEFIVNNCFINYKAAFEAGMEIAFTGWIESLLGEKSDETLASNAAQLNGFIIYKKSDFHESFEDTMIALLAENDAKGQDVDLTMLAANYYQWEVYTSSKFFENYNKRQND